MTCRRLTLVLLGLAVAALAQASVPGSLAGDLRDYVAMPALPGYEQTLAQHIADELRGFSPRRDNLGDVIVTVGTGAPTRLFAAPLDEPGYVVSGITADGYLRLQRLPTRGALPLFNALANAQPVQIESDRGTWINGVMAGLSIHLQPGRVGAPDPDDLDNLYVDVGASDAATVRAAGIGLLSPVALDRSLRVEAGGQLQGFGIGDRYGAAALVEVLRHLDPSRLSGAVEFAFLTQQWTGDRGWDRVLSEAAPVGAGTPPWASLVLVGGEHTANGGRGSTLAEREGVEEWSVPVGWPATPAETIEGRDLAGLVARLETALGEPAVTAVLPAPELLPEPGLPAPPAHAPTPSEILQAVAAQYGVNPHEQRVGASLRALLPAWAEPTRDDAGNLMLHWGDGGADTPRLLFVAHQDEIGYEVTAIEPDGRLALRSRGGGDPNYYLGHPMRVHTAAGMRPGVIELPPGWSAPGFRLGGRPGPVYADIGARSAAEVEQLGVADGDSVTIPKQYRALLDGRATDRAFDDRVGDAALIAAAWQLGPSLPGRDVTLAWSTGEEIGLVGAKAMATRLAAAGRTPDYVFAIDTFVSSDSPLESHRFADTPLGQGFVIRAVDDSSLTPWPLVQRLQALARQGHIPYQTGATGGGNDGSVFVPFGSVDVPLGWPLRTSHSPGEVIATSDLDALTRMVVALAHNW